MRHSRVFVALPFLLTTTLLTGLPTPGAAAVDCEGDACAQVSVTFDEARQQYRAQNNSTTKWVRVSASNRASAASACVAPGKAADLPLQTIVGAYRADFAAARCGAPPVIE